MKERLLIFLKEWYTIIYSVLLVRLCNLYLLLWKANKNKKNRRMFTSSKKFDVYLRQTLNQ